MTSFPYRSPEGCPFEKIFWRIRRFRSAPFLSGGRRVSLLPAADVRAIGPCTPRGCRPPTFGQWDLAHLADAGRRRSGNGTLSASRLRADEVRNKDRNAFLLAIFKNVSSITRAGERMVENVMIMGAAGRDFHNFNARFRNDPGVRVVAFTATQIPDIAGRRYPPALAGPGYPDGIPIYPEDDLVELIGKHDVTKVVFSYSDVTNQYVMEKAALVNAAGADFELIRSGTMLRSAVPLIAICATRTGCGKSQTTRRVAQILAANGKRVAVIRHPMPYGDLEVQAVQRFATYEDLDTNKCTIEEREEYEPHIDAGYIVYAGVDYEAILRAAESESDVVIWDGGNNDVSFYAADLYITVTDPHRVGDEMSYYPSHENILLADVIIINKVDTADLDDVRLLRQNVRAANPDAVIVEAASPISVDDPEMIRGKRALLIEDGPTTTHGGMPYGAAFIAADRFGASEFVRPKEFAVGTILETYEKFPHLEYTLPAMGYSPQQVADLQETINRSDAEVVVSGTPIDLNRIIKPDKVILRVRYDLEEIGRPKLDEIIAGFLKEKGL